MVARVVTFTIEGLQPRPVWVEVDIRAGLPAFTVVGLADPAVREARDRVRAAILNSGFEFPQRRITANLAPANLRKVGPGFDLALAVGVLVASQQLSAALLSDFAVFGELSLLGELRSIYGALAVAEGVSQVGLRGVVLPRDNAREAALIEGVTVAGVTTLRAAAKVLTGGEIPALPSDTAQSTVSCELDLADIRGQAPAVMALEVAAAGGHNLLLQGPPGTGKTMLAQRLPTIMPPLTRQESIEVTRVHSVVGSHSGEQLVSRRPFRAPHHTISAAGLVGGGKTPVPGEATLAHRGVLFLDELSEFSRCTLESLRQPLEDRCVVIVRAQRTVVFPTEFMLVAATNPCPCGVLNTPGDRCVCTAADLARRRRHLSSALLDRIDILIDVQRPESAALSQAPTTSSASVRERVTVARERQASRLERYKASCNAQLDIRSLRSCLQLTEQAQSALARAYQRGTLSARGHDRVLRVAQTVADLAGKQRIEVEHVMCALTMRQLVGDSDGR